MAGASKKYETTNNLCTNSCPRIAAFDILSINSNSWVVICGVVLYKVIELFSKSKIDFLKQLL